MKRIFLLVLLFFSMKWVYAQVEQETPASKLANHMADKLKDSLDLSPQQRVRVFQINMVLSSQKADARQKSSERTSVGAELQRIEKRRDSMYKEVLTAEQYLRYIDKKRSLITAG